MLRLRTNKETIPKQSPSSRLPPCPVSSLSLSLSLSLSISLSLSLSFYLSLSVTMVSAALEYPLGAVLGIAVGSLGGYAGIGGAPFLVAGLVLVLGYSQRLAQGTVVAVMLGPMSLPGVMVMKDRVIACKNYIYIGVVTYASCSYVGATIAYLFNDKLMSQIFAIFIFVLGCRNIMNAIRDYLKAKEDEKNGVELKSSGAIQTGGSSQADNEAASSDASNDAVAQEDVDMEKAADVEDDGILDHHRNFNPDGITYAVEKPYKFSLITAAVMGCIVGTVGGLFGIGAGVLMVPLMVNVWGIHKDDARAISLGILCPPVSLGAVIRYQKDGDINWWMVLLQFICYVVTNYYGAKVGKRAKPVIFNRVLGAMLAVLGIVMFTLAALDCDGWCG